MQSNMKRFLLAVILIAMLGGVGYAATRYMIETSHNDELFIINGEKYSARTYCFGMWEGDYVIFIKGSPSGFCTTAELLNLRTKQICRVWCE